MDPDEQALVCKRLANGESLSAIAREFNTTRQTIMRVRERGKTERVHDRQPSPRTHASY
ncbi:helix-turn-helix domain-containing protein [Paraburkholderia solisilvae]|uniref:helix-turn-helix domain-containing protein n=1 Tax=Paraburkholderia solisilvae TaxID=624376 RepID=UPI0024841AE9|nr:helix-turn-helix domain-containing protein [Paraburkholderia solisilvae]